MERIIEFLMGNIVWIVIVLGIVTKLLGGSGSRKSSTPRMPSFGGNMSSGAPRRGSAHEESEEAAEPALAEAQLLTEPSSGRSQAMMMTDEARLIEEPEVIRPSRLLQPAKPKAAEPQPERKSARQLPQTTSELQNAIIWSEILGPPRSKRSYRK